MATTLAMEPRPIPLTQDEHGIWRVTGTTIPLERVIECFRAGVTPEGIVDSFDSLRLADVYLVIGYYLDHKADVDEYLRQEEEKAEEVRRLIEAGQPARPGLREELLARKAQLEGSSAPVGH